jgi:hypothetical protein|tara:strand:- start:366 stop:677 length:312 start_codon:yes stop_codon:yes gene_type:complete
MKINERLPGYLLFESIVGLALLGIGIAILWDGIDYRLKATENLVKMAAEERLKSNVFAALSRFPVNKVGDLELHEEFALQNYKNNTLIFINKLTDQTVFIELK